MKKVSTFVLAVICGLGVTADKTEASVIHDQNITAIFGSGNPNNGWETSTDGDITVGLRAKNRVTGAVPNDGLGTFNFTTGNPPGSPTKTLWNLEFSMNSDTMGVSGKTLNNYRWELKFDTDPSAGQSWITMDPFLLFPDMSLGNNSTLNGQGVENGAFSSWNVGQNSENGSFFPFLIPPTQAGTYDVELSGYKILLEGSSSPIVTSSARIEVTAVPEGSPGLAGLGCAIGLIGVNSYRTRQNKQTTTA